MSQEQLYRTLNQGGTCDGNASQRDCDGNDSVKRETVSDMIRKQITFYGQVQGVGFRYRAKCAAEFAGATGWVRNEEDGSVSMEIQGTEEQIDEVIQEIERGSYVRIENMNVRSIPIETEERRFRVR